jgi:small subunit ribosomal protein S1
MLASMSFTDPWEAFALSHQRDERLTAPVRQRVDDLGLFVDLEGGIYGIVHLRDIDWETPGEQAIQRYAVGDRIEAVILSIDVERQRISLGIKQLSQDPRRRPPGDELAPIEPRPKSPNPPTPLTQATKR